MHPIPVGYIRVIQNTGDCCVNLPYSIMYSLLSHQDSNLGKQNQNLMCYHYTMGQFY